MAEDERDREVLAWVARFQGVSASLVAVRFGVSVQRANARLRRFEDAGLVVRQGGLFEELYVSVTRRGLTALGLPRWRPPRGTSGWREQLDIAWLVAGLELERPGVRVFTQREMRDAGAARFSVLVTRAYDIARPRLPVAFVDESERGVAVEIARVGRRLGPEVKAYSGTERFERVRFYVADPRTARLVVKTVAAHHIELPPSLARHRRAAVVEPALWPWLGADDRAAVEAALRPGR